MKKIKITISPFTDHYLICAGDYNSALTNPNQLIDEFVEEFELKKTVPDTNLGGVSYTFSNDSLNHYSTIDHILVSKAIYQNLTNYEILESAVNLSDHNPVKVMFSFAESFLKCDKADTCLQKCNINNKNSNYNYRWDHANTENYYYLMLENWIIFGAN